MVVVAEEHFLDDPQSNTTPLAYAPSESPLMREINVHFEAKENSWLQTYDPLTQFIMVVVRLDQGTSAYLADRLSLSSADPITQVVPNPFFDRHG